MKKLILINAKFLDRPATGVERFAFETLMALDRLLEEKNSQASKFTFGLLVPKNSKKNSPFKNIPILHIGKTSGLIWEQIEVPLVSFGKNLVNLCNAAPIIKRKQLVVIHDATPAKMPSAFSKSFALWYRVLMPFLGKFSKIICTVSNFSKLEINRYYKINLNKIKILSEGGEHILREKSDAKILDLHHLNEKPYILAVSSMAPHKNFKFLFEAFSLIENPFFDLVVAGGTNPKVFSAKNTEVPAFVKHVGYVSDAELRALMENAMLFVFPSLYEGFGIPPLEAMNCGCPVLVSNTASMPEVCSDAALYFDPTNISQLVELVLKTSTNKFLLNDLKNKSLYRASYFSWENSAQKLISACEIF